MPNQALQQAAGADWFLGLHRSPVTGTGEFS